ncbi:MAG: glycosyltransferase family 2 protein [Bacteroidota bacterium]
MKNWPKISIVTINYNQAQYLEETILSVLNQNYPNLEYIIIDGGSNDGSVEIIKRYANQLAYWESEKDEGSYHAVQKGFDKCSGDIMAWISSDDFYVPNAFFAVAEIFETFPEVKWVMGIPREYTAKGSMISRISLPWSRWSKYRFYTRDFQFIQQESSFWKREVWEKAGSMMDLSFSYAGDLELWSRFFRNYKLHTTLATLAGFRHHHNKQKSVEFRKDYMRECERAIDRELQNKSFFQRLFYLFLRLMSFVFGPFFFYDIPILNLFYQKLFAIPKPINYDFETEKYTRRNQMVKLPPLYFFKRQIHRKMFKSKS